MALFFPKVEIQPSHFRLDFFGCPISWIGFFGLSPYPAVHYGHMVWVIFGRYLPFLLFYFQRVTKWLVLLP